MRAKEIVVGFKKGIHARPACELTKISQKYTSKITFMKQNMEVDAKSILGVLSLGISENEIIKVMVEGEDEDNAISAIERFLSQEA